MVTAEHILILRNAFGKYADFPKDEWNRFEQLLTYRKIASGKYFVESGETAKEVGFILNGLFRKFYRTEDGKEYIKDFSRENQLLTAYSSLLLGKPSTLNIQAVEDSVLITVPFSQFTAFYDHHVCWQQLGRKIAEQLFIDRERREWQLLLLPAKKRYEFFAKEQSGLVKRVPQYEVASYLGISPITLSRLIGKVRPIGPKKKKREQFGNKK